MRSCAAGLCILLTATSAWAGSDYDPANVDWNGTARLFALARKANVRLVTERRLDLSRLTLRTAVLFLGPKVALPLALRSFVQAGGRVGIADDQGATDEILGFYGLRRIAEPQVGLALGGLPHLAVALPRRRHMLTWGIDAVVTNHPVAFHGFGRVPLLSFEGGDGLLYAVRDGNGEILVLGDPSVLINQMLPFGDNEHFARGLLRYLSRGTPARKVALLHGSFDVLGTLPAALRPSGGAAVASKARAIAEEAAYGVNAIAWELMDQRPLSGVFMALAVFGGGVALLLLAALWGGSAPLLHPRQNSRGVSSLRRIGASERARLAISLRLEIEERLQTAGDLLLPRERNRLERALARLPRAASHPGARVVPARALLRAARFAGKILAGRRAG